MDLPKGTVSFDGRGLRLDTSEQAQIICDELIGKDVEILILQGNTFGIEAAERVGLELAKQSCLREAHFKDLFTSRGREEVPEALDHLLKGISDSGAQLTLLDLSDNAIGPIGAPSVIKFFESSSADTIEKLYLNNCGLGPEGSSSIAASIKRLKNLREFICGRNRLENKGATNMSQALKELQCVTLLKFNQNGIKVEGITEIAEALKFHRQTIKELDLSDNTIKKEGATALAEFITGASALEILKLDDSLLENDGFSIICKAMSVCPNKRNIIRASFEGNEISGHKSIDLIQVSFKDFPDQFELVLLENEFTRAESDRLNNLGMEILIDDIDSDDDGEDDSTDDCRQEDGHQYDSDDVSNGYVNIEDTDSELREVSQDFISATSANPFNESQVNSSFHQLILFGDRPTNGDNKYHAVQILCEELGLIKSEQTRKRKPLAREAIIYIGKRLNELPTTFRDFFEVVVKNNDELSCGKILFEKLDI